METKVCNTCNIEKPITAFNLAFENTPVAEKYGARYQNRCKSCYAERYRNKLKIDLVNAFQGKCQCCGEDDFRLLTLDHINDDGGKHRESGFQCHQIIAEARREGFPKDKYTLLCFNCNMGRSCNNGICPHKDVSKQLAWESLLKTQEKNYTCRKTNTSNLPEARKVLAAKRLEQKADSLTKNLSKEQLEQLMSMLQR